MSGSSLSRELWRANLDLVTACVEHPFVRGLGDGTLSSEIWTRYVAQDAFFLEAFFRAYAVAAARCEGSHRVAVVMYRLMGGVLDELEMHRRSATALGIDLEHVEPLAATTCYVELLTDTAWHRGLAEIIACMTPCTSLYAHLGRTLAGARREAHPYRSWINAYSGSEMTDLASTLESVLDDVAEDTPEVRRLYRRAMECELVFFDQILEESPSPR